MTNKLETIIERIGGNTDKLKTNLDTERYNMIISCLGGNPKELKTNLSVEKLDKIVELFGGDVNALKTNLHSERLNKIIELKGGKPVTNDFLDEIINLLPSLLEKEVEGQEITINDGAASVCKIEIQGNTEQEVKESHNLVDETKLELGSFNGNADVYAQEYEMNTRARTDYIAIEPNTKVTLQTFEDDLLIQYICEYDENKKGSLSERPIRTVNATSYTFTTTTTTKFIRFNVKYTDDRVVNLETIGKIQLVLGGSNKEYEPYGTCPSPNFPSEIKTVKGNVEIELSNKNLFTKLTKGILINATTGEEATGKNYSATDFIEFNFDTADNYYISGLCSDIRSFVAAYNENKEFLGRTGGSLQSFISFNKNSFVSGTAQGTGEIKYIRISHYALESDSGTIDDIDNLKIQLEEGITATEYAPHRKQIYELTIPEEYELAKIGDYEDFYFKENGKWYKYKQIKKNTLKASNISGMGAISENLARFYTSYIERRVMTSETEIYVLSNKFKAMTIQEYNDISKIEVQGIVGNTVNQAIFFRINKTLIGGDTVELCNKYLEKNPVEIYYILAEPIKELITDKILISQLNSLANARTYYGTTYISANSEIKPTLKVTYKQLKGVE